jgi:hypothetical protein
MSLLCYFSTFIKYFKKRKSLFLSNSDLFIQLMNLFIGKTGEVVLLLAKFRVIVFVMFSPLVKSNVFTLYC